MADSKRKTANFVSMSEPQGDGYLANSVIGITGGDREQIISAPAFFVTEYIPVSEGTYYYYSDLYRATANNAKFMFYNANKEFIGYANRLPVLKEQPVYELSSFSAPANAAYMRMNIDKSSTKNCLYTSQLPAYKPYGWLHSLRKLTTATDTFTTLPVDIYADGNNATVGLVGNTVQNGTPTPSAPISVQGVGNKTANLFNTFDIIGQVPSTGNGALVSYNGSTTSFIPISSGNVVVTKPEGILIYLMLYAANGDYIGYDIANAGTTINGSNISGYDNAKLARLRIDRTSGLDDIQIMFNSGSTALPYEPYGFKIPVSSGGVTTNIYLGSTQTVRAIKKLVLTGNESFIVRSGEPSNIFFYEVSNTNFINNQAICSHYINQNSGSFDVLEDKHCLIHIGASGDKTYIGLRDSTFPQTNEGAVQLRTWLSAQYAAGTPVTVWYVLATPKTAAVNEPLMKIGDYADTVSGITIPTITGKDTFDVLTTLKPSEVSLTYTGWHDASVKEAVRTVNIYDKYSIIEIENVGTRYGQYIEAGVYSVYNNTDNIVYWGANDLQARQVACNARSTATFTISGTPRFGIFMPYNDDSLGEITIVKGSVVPDHYIPYIDWD